MLVFIILFNSFTISSYAKPIKTWIPIMDMSAGELLELAEQGESFIRTQVGVFFTGTAHQNYLNKEAFMNWLEVKYKDGFDGDPWNAVKYYDKNITRDWVTGGFTLSSEYVNDYVKFLNQVIDTEFGYYLVKTASIPNMPSSVFEDKRLNAKAVDIIKANELVYLDYISTGAASARQYLSYAIFKPDVVFVKTDSTNMTTYNKNWTSVPIPAKRWNYLEDKTIDGFAHYPSSFIPVTFKSGSTHFRGIFTKDGHNVKVFKNLPAYKDYDIGKQPYLATSKFNDLASSVTNNTSTDNSITVEGDKFLNTDWSTTNNNYYNEANTIINNNIDNSVSGGGLTEEQMQKLLDEFFEKSQENTGGGNTGGDGGDTGGDGGIGSGVGAVIEAIGKVIDVLVTFIAKLIGLLADLVKSALDALDRLSVYTERFSVFLSNAFEFIPPEIWSVIVSGITLLVIVAVIKAVKK